MSRLSRTLATLGVLVALGLPGSALAGPPERITENYTILFPNTEAGVVVLVNTTRAAYCTAEVVAWEEAFIAWIAWDEGGQIGPEPIIPDVTFPDGLSPITSTFITTGKDALVRHIDGKNLEAEVWRIVDDPPLVGPCTDTAPGGLLISGKATVSGNDNDLFGSGTRGNSFGDSGSIRGTGPDGRKHSYTWRFHVNSKCYTPDLGEPRCLLETFDLR